MNPLENQPIEYLVGNLEQLNIIHPEKPFNSEVVSFLAELSKEILFDKEAKLFPDVISFGYWCRKSNITKLSFEYKTINNRLGLGLVFHITPTNVPVNFAFSYVFSLIAGNSNIVRVPSKNFKQIEIICRIMKNILSTGSYPTIAQKSLFVRYPQVDSITAAFSNKCNARIIWGGDLTVNTIRKIPIATRSIDIAFADRYSFSIIDPASILKLTELELKRLSENFYNDTYLMDQNACSSPHLIVWRNASADVNIDSAKLKFWNAIHAIAEEKYDLQPVNAIDKFTLLCSDAITNSDIVSLQNTSNYLYEVALGSMPENITGLNGKFGYFYELDINDLKELSNIIETKIQTITYYGVPKDEILEFIIEQGLIGVDRIVPIGSALDIGIFWDGYDLVKTLSRLIVTN